MGQNISTLTRDRYENQEFHRSPYRHAFGSVRHLRNITMYSKFPMYVYRNRGQDLEHEYYIMCYQRSNAIYLFKINMHVFRLSFGWHRFNFDH